MVAGGHLPAGILAAGLLAMAGAPAVRVGLWRSFCVRPVAPADAGLWERRMVMAASAAGTAWAVSGAAVAFGALPQHVEGLMAISAGGMIAGSMFSLTAKIGRATV